MEQKDMTVNIGDSFELLSKDEWNNYLSVDIFDHMIIPIEKFSQFESDDCDPKSLGYELCMYPQLKQAIKAHNNKVGDLIISYALCKHYFDKGIPDDPWYISPGKNGESVQYFPNFNDEHWMRRYWFNHFAENLYLSYFSIWDGIAEILNIFYSLNEPNKREGFQERVANRLKSDHKEIYKFLGKMIKDHRYEKASNYRNNFAHWSAPSTITNFYAIRKGQTVSTHRKVDGKVVTVEEKNCKVLSCGVGDYTPTATVMKNIDEFATFCGNKITELVDLMLHDFSISKNPNPSEQEQTNSEEQALL